MTMAITFLQSDKRFPKVLDKVRLISREVVHKFGLHYGGVDVMYSKDTKKSLSFGNKYHSLSNR